MMQTRRFPVIVAAAALATSSLALAQYSPPSEKTDQKPQVSKQTKSDKKLELRRASVINGTKVIASDNRDLGEIKDLAIDSSSGRVLFAIVSSGGALGVGDTLTAVPCKALKFSDLNKPAQLNTTEQTFKSAPTIKEDAWDTLNDTNWRTTAYKHYSLDPKWDAPLNRERMENPTAGQNVKLVKASDAIGMDVHNQQDEDLGEVNDLVIDVNQFQVVYSVLGFGGVMGMGEKLFAVPWQSFKHDAQKEMYVLNIDKAKLAGAPGFDKDKWPDMTDPNWSKNVYAFYGEEEPAWVYGFSGEGNIGDSDDDDDLRGWQSDSEYNKLFKADASTSISGKVTSVSRSAPMSGMSDAVVLNIQTSDQQTMTVHVGPASYLDDQNIKFNQGDQVTVTGSKATVNGKNVILATQVTCNGKATTLRQSDGTPMWKSTQPGASDR